MTPPEPCVDKPNRCYSPIACNAFGYCRERNRDGLPSEQQAAEWRACAAERAKEIPALERHCGSWVVVDRATGLPALETFSRTVAEAINQKRYEVLTAAQWLARLNKRVRAERHSGGPKITTFSSRVAGLSLQCRIATHVEDGVRIVVDWLAVTIAAGHGRLPIDVESIAEPTPHGYRKLSDRLNAEGLLCALRGSDIEPKDAQPKREATVDGSRWIIERARA